MNAQEVIAAELDAMQLHNDALRTFPGIILQISSSSASEPCARDDKMLGKELLSGL